MKKILLLLTVFVFLVPVAKPADFVDGLSEYRAQVKAQLGVSESSSEYVSDSVLNRLIRGAIVKVMPIVKANKEQFTIVTTANTGGYNLDSTVVGVLDVGWRKNDTLKSFLYAPKSKWYEFEVKTALGKDGYEKRPSYYEYIDGRLFLYPIPVISGDTIVVDAYTKLENISTASSLSGIPSYYRTAILDYVAYMVAMSKQHPLTDVYYKNYVESVQAINQRINGRGLSIEKVTP